MKMIIDPLDLVMSRLVFSVFLEKDGEDPEAVVVDDKAPPHVTLQSQI